MADRQVSECIRRSRGDVLFLFTGHACVKLLFGGGENYAPVAYFATQFKFCRVVTIGVCLCARALQDTTI